MDAPEEDVDIKLQKISGDLIADFDRSLQPFLRKRDVAGGTPVRSRVRTRETDRLVSTLDPFQELPQLLDPHLPKWLPTLGDAFLEYHLARRHAKVPSTRSELLMLLPRAICKLIYTFCKIRGEKVIVRFLSNEAKYLELLLSALEDSEGADQPTQWTWEERYVVLLWLSHLMLAPFDLSTISSQEVEDDELARIPGFHWPVGLPSITTRILPLAIKYLALPGKERDASKALLVRISMRRDMQQLGVLDALVKWALSALQPCEDETERTPYHYIGVLAFLSGALASSADTSDMDRHLMTIFHAVHGITSEGGQAALSSALARKTMIKVIRAIAVLVLRSPEQDMASMEMIEATIGFLLESLADNDTPVRFAASKALSIITLKLDPDMASQVVEAVLEALNRNVLHTKDPLDPTAPSKKDLSGVNPLEWHGLMLTLSHLLYRRSPPADNLADIVHALLMGLSFERRNTSGGSIGTNVRDAACFGIWALARRYTTSELLAVPTASIPSPTSGASILQILGTELVAAACLDPAGNIRRGSSAALQELIGRHPDTVEKGIWVVQTVDYHAVALRSRALQHVALSVTKLSSRYGEAILDALLGWRGIGDVDVASRRAAGTSYGTITAELASTAQEPLQRLTQSVSLVLGQIKTLEARQVEERHGLLLCFAAVLDALPAVGKEHASAALDEFIYIAMDALLELLRDCDTKTYRKPELIAEAASRLIVSSFPVLQAVASAPPTALLPGSSVTAQSTYMAHVLESVAVRPDKLCKFVDLAKSNLQKSLVRQEQDLISAASEAAVILLVLCNREEREEIVQAWADAVRHRPASKTGTATGHFSALATSYPVISASEAHKTLICNSITDRWTNDKDIETHTSILQSLAGSDLLKQNTEVFLSLVVEGLNDYYTNARGDVGSHVRLQAIRVTKSLWDKLDGPGTKMLISQLFLPILRLAAEKLDRVRVEAQAALALVLKPSHSSELRRSTFSSKSYFLILLDLLQQDWLQPVVSEAVKADTEKWMESLLAGLVSSADTGNEDLVIATRAALCEFCERSDANTDAVCGALVRNLKSWQGVDRVLVPTLEVVAFLFHASIFRRCRTVNYKSLCLLVQKSCYKSGNARKIEACIRVYGAIAELGRDAVAVTGSPRNSSDLLATQASAREARTRLAALMFHPWPRVKSMVVDELWVLHYEDPAANALKGVDWGSAPKEKIKSVVESLGLAG